MSTDINCYDEYGVPAATNIGRFQYTGQAWFPELGLYNYKARFYDPKLGRFLQADPIGYGDGMNMYNYAASYPVNKVDPSGLYVDAHCGNWCVKYEDGPPEPPHIVIGDPCRVMDCRAAIPPAGAGYGNGGYNTDRLGGLDGDIVVIGRRNSPKTSDLPARGSRSLNINDLGPNTNVIAIIGTIGIRGKNLDIFIQYIEGKPGVLRVGLNKSISMAQIYNLNRINISSYVANEQLGRLLVSDSRLFRNYPGTIIYYNGPLTTISIPVPKK